MSSEHVPAVRRPAEELAVRHTQPQPEPTFYYFEMVSDAGNWGKFRVNRIFDDLSWRTHDGVRFCASRWGREHVDVFDMETGKGARFRHGGHAVNDVKKAGIHVCVLYPVFLEWLYQHSLDDLAALPKVIPVWGVPLRMVGYNLPGSGVFDTKPDNFLHDVVMERVDPLALPGGE